jgi:transmembrane sensor
MATAEQRIRSAVTELAADWYVAHRAGPLSEARRGEFLAWLKSSPVHIEEYLGIAALDRVLSQATDHPPISLEDLTGLGRDDRPGSVVEMNPATPGVKADVRRVVAPRQIWLRAAAAAVVSVAAIWLLWGKLAGSRSPPPQSYETARGAKGSWPLADGSTLRLDTDSAVTVRFSSAARVLELHRGQLWVAVAQDVRRPLRVEAGTAEIVAVGTEFDVYRLARVTRVTVIAGQVAVSVTGAPQRPLRVAADQQVEIIDGRLPDVPAPAHRREATAWLEQKILFEHRPLSEVADEFNRYNAVPFIIDGPGLRGMLISGAFDASDTESFVSFLRSLPGVHVERLPNALKITSR